jgi:Histidine kinase-, DNA gyrase B-, and HSP90-like ATPase
MTDKPDSEAVSFKPRARLMELLGEQLIKDHRLALFELVKNAYDADATEVVLKFKDLSTETPVINIKDDGSGMTRETILSAWMEPASDHKAIARLSGERSKKFDRLPVGEKGVGRFAVHKLSKAITMVTKVEGSKEETIVEIDWVRFTEKKYLEDAPVSIKTRSAETFQSIESHGTSIELSGLKQNWTRGDIRKLYRSVTAMTTSPELPSLGVFKSSKVKSDTFAVKFKLDDKQKSWLEDMFLSKDAQAFSMYSFEFELGEHGLSWHYSFKPFAAMGVDFKGLIPPRDEGCTNSFNVEFFKFLPSTESDRQKRDRLKDFKFSDIGVGAIRGRIVGFDLDQTIIARYVPDGAGLKKFLDEQGGVRVYRDGLRVFDYGEPGNDWLGLDLRRINQPTKRLSNNILIGEIHLDLESSYNLKEKTNREGFVDNPAFQEFRYAVLCSLIQFEIERNKDKDLIRSAIAKPLQIEAYPSGYVRPEDAIADLRASISKNPAHLTLMPLVERVRVAYEETRDALLSAVGAGLGLSTVFHELERGVRGLNKAITSGQSAEHVIRLSEALVELLSGASTFLRTQKTEKLMASKLLQEALFSCQSRFVFHNIRFLNGFDSQPSLDFEIKGTRRMFVAALVNLIDNAIYWTRLARESSETEGTIWVGPASEFEGPAIVVADSGAGFLDDPGSAIQPFYTRKTDGMGMGLYYVDMVMKSHNGRLAFPQNTEVDVPARCTGAKIAMVFQEVGKKK